MDDPISPFPALAPTLGSPPSQPQNSGDFPLIMLNALGEGLDDIFNFGSFDCEGGQQQQQKGCSASSVWQPPHGVDAAGHSGPAEGAALRASSSGTMSGNSSSPLVAPPSPYDQLVQLQQQLQVLQANVGAQLQQLQQPGQQGEQHAGQLPPCPDMQEMQQTLANMQRLLEQSQQQQQQQGQQMARARTASTSQGSLRQQSAEQPVQQLLVAGPAPSLPQVLPKLEAALLPVPVPAPLPTSATAPPARLTRESSKRSKPRGKPLAELERQLEAKQAEADALVRQNSELKRRQRMLQTFIQVREVQMNRLQQMRAKSLPAMRQIQASSKSAVMRGLTLQELTSMDVSKSNAVFGESVQEVSRLLGLATGQEPTPALLSQAGMPARSHADVTAELEAVIKGMIEVSHIMMVFHPSFAKIRYDHGASSQQAPSEHWNQVMLGCALQEEQALDMMQLYDIHRSLTGKVYEQRQQVVLQLQELLSSGSRVVTDVLARAKIQALTERLHRSLQQERCLIFLTSEVFTELLSIEQIARITVASYPYKPDELAFLHAVVTAWRQLGEGAGAGSAAVGQWCHPAMPVITTA